MDRRDLLENLRDYSPKEIADAIRSGVVTLYDLKSYSHGQFTPLLQRHVMLQLERAEKPEPVTDIPQPEEPDMEEAPRTTTPEPVSIPEPEIESEPEPEPEFQYDPEPFKPIFMEPEQTSTYDKFNARNQRVDDSWQEPATIENYPEPAAPPVYPTYTTPQQNVNNAGPNAHMSTPPSINKFSWGGFVFAWLWGIFNGVYWSLLSLIPIVNIIVIFVLGFRGRRSAWQNKRFASVAEFERTQKNWDTAGIIIFIISIIFFLLMVFIIFAAAYYGYDSDFDYDY